MYNGLTFAVLQSLGNFLVAIERLIICAKGFAITSAPSFKNLAGIESIPVALDILRSFNKIKTSSSSIYLKAKTFLLGNFWEI